MQSIALTTPKGFKHGFTVKFTEHYTGEEAEQMRQSSKALEAMMEQLMLDRPPREPTPLLLISVMDLSIVSLEKAIEDGRAKGLEPDRPSINSYLRSRYLHAHKGKRLRRHKRRTKDEITLSKYFKDAYPIAVEEDESLNYSVTLKVEP